MKVTYDAETDTLTVLLREGPARASEEERSGVILDYDDENRLIAIEILDASTPRRGSTASTPSSST